MRNFLVVRIGRAAAGIAVLGLALSGAGHAVTTDIHLQSTAGIADAPLAEMVAGSGRAAPTSLDEWPW